MGVLSLIILIGIIGGLYWLVHSIFQITYFGCTGMIMEFIIYFLIAMWLGDLILRFLIKSFQIGLVVLMIGAILIGIYALYDYFKNKK